MQKFYGIELDEGGFIVNLRIEPVNDIDGIPDNITTPGRIWFNENKQKLQYTFINENTNLDIKTINEAGWEDLIGNMAIGKGGNKNAPIWADLGNGIYSWIFADNKDLELQLQFHTNHNIDYTKKILSHLHWSPLSTSIGNVKWDVKLLIVRGNKGDLVTSPAQYNYSMLTPSNGINGEHLIFEDIVNTIDAIEPDCIIYISLTRNALSPLDTFIGSVSASYLDFHYWTDHRNTPGRILDFNIPTEPIPN